MDRFALGRDVAELVREVGEDVEDFAVGDRVFALAWATYAELCVVRAPGNQMIRQIAKGGDWRQYGMD